MIAVMLLVHVQQMCHCFCSSVVFNVLSALDFLHYSVCSNHDNCYLISWPTFSVLSLPLCLRVE